MWKCEKCGREFKRLNQSHFCAKVKNVDEYIDNFPIEIKLRLDKIREIILSNLNESEESIKWEMPSYSKNEYILHLSAYKNHISLFVGEDVIEVFKDRLADYETVKGNIKLNHSEEIPYDLIKDIIVYIDILD